MVTRATVPVQQQLSGTGAQENSTPHTLTVSPEDKALDETGLPTDPCVTDVKCISRVRTAAESELQPCLRGQPAPTERLLVLSR